MKPVYFKVPYLQERREKRRTRRSVRRGAHRVAKQEYQMSQIEFSV